VQSLAHWRVLTRQHCVTRCNTLQHTATRNSAFSCSLACSHTATHCNTLQHTATHCNTLQRCNAIPGPLSPIFALSLARPTVVLRWRKCVAVCCSVLQCVAVCCSVLQCVAMQYERGTSRNRAGSLCVLHCVIVLLQCVAVHT